MAIALHRLKQPRKILVKELNDQITCQLCGGYFVDATTLVDCVHSFCRACIVRHFESSKLCPTCGSVVHKSKPLSCLREDTALQSLVYKVIPGLYGRELQRRTDFYHSTHLRPSSACSDDSLLGHQNENTEEWVLSNIGDPNLYFSPDDSISLSLEYYTRPPATPEQSDGTDNVANDNNTSTTPSHTPNPNPNTETKAKYIRYLQCPAAVTMDHIMKFLRMKHALTDDHRVDIIYDGEVLPQYFSLMDVAYTFNWKRDGPLRLFFRIFVPIIRTNVLQIKEEKPIAPIKNDIIQNNNHIDTKINNLNLESQNQMKLEKREEINSTVNEPKKTEHKTVKSSENKDKEEKVVKAHKEVKEPKTYENCVYDYTEPDKDEIKAFAEKRDREWALQKQEDEYHITKKRKKNKHSKNESMHKKKKFHAEITSNNTEIVAKSEDSLKLKVKLSLTNGHKHKHKNSFEPTKISELSSKEKLLQMRQVRHKKIDNEEKKQIQEPIQKYKLVPVIDEPIKEKVEKKPEVVEKKPEIPKIEKPIPEIVPGKTLRSDFTFKTNLSKDFGNKMATTVERLHEQKNGQRKPEVILSKEMKTTEIKKEEKSPTEPQKPKPEIKMEVPKIKVEIPKIKQEMPKIKQEPKEPPQTQQQQPQPKPKPIPSPNLQKESITQKTLELSTAFQNSTSREFVTKNFTVSKIEQGVKRKAEDNSMTIDKRPSLEITLINPPIPRPQSASPQNKPAVPQKTDTPKMKPNRPPPATIPLHRIHNHKSVNLKSGISIIPKAPEKCTTDNIGALDLSKPSKMEIKVQDRPVCASPRPVNQHVRPNSASPKIGNSVLSPRQPMRSPTEGKIGEKMVSPNMTNLQMLSDSAVQLQREMMSKSSATPPVPNLIKKSPLKIPSPQNQINNKSPNFLQQQQQKHALLTKGVNLIPKTQPVPYRAPMPNLISNKNLQKLPKLNEINKGQLRSINSAQIRNARPAQNQSIRNIPNPSLIVRQQNQNRMLMTTPASPEIKSEVVKSSLLSPKQNSDKVEPKKEFEPTTKTPIPALKQIESIAVTVSKN